MGGRACRTARRNPSDVRNISVTDRSASELRFDRQDLPKVGDEAPAEAAEQVEDGADQPFGLAQRHAEHGAQCRRRQDRQGEYQGCPPRVVRGSARQAAIASSVNQTVKLPR